MQRASIARAVSSRNPIIIVSGLPRSGTSMAMQMLRAGGIEVVTDALRSADADNPHGYLEFERVKHLRTDKSWLDDAHGKAVKVIHMLLPELPLDREYRVIFMRRDLREVIKSQGTMLERSGRKGAGIPAERLIATFEGQLRSVDAFLGASTCFKVLSLDHARCLADPALAASQLRAFLDSPLDEAAMVAAVDPALHRNKA